jgi:Tfp pilus assembly protein PilO
LTGKLRQIKAMDEKKKFTFTVILGLAVLWLIFTNFCLPTLKDNTLRLTEYRKLREDTRIIEGLSDEKFQAWDEKISAAGTNLEKKFLEEGKMKLAQQLTRLPANSNILFLDIKQKQAVAKQDYEVLPVDITMKAQFLDLIRYLATIESNPLLIGVESLRVSKPMPEAKDLDVKLTFSGFRLLSKSKPVSKYLEERFHPFDEAYFKSLIGPIDSRSGINVNVISGLYNPFLSVYDSLLGQKKPGVIRTTDELSLRGTLRIEGKNAALINEMIVREGDKVDGMEVVQIGDGQVVLLRSGKRQILKMGVEDGFIRP